MNGKDEGIRIMLTGGGTGGHLFPGIAVAEALCERLPGSEVVFIGDRRRMDQTSLKKHGFAVRRIHSHGIKGKSLLQLLKALAVMPFSFCEALFHVLNFRPHIVVGVGGYVTGPVIAAARLAGRRTIIHEQNAIPGLANRKLGKFAQKICLSIPGSERYFREEKTVLTGNPVRRTILNLTREEKREKKEKLTLLILGGSQGARAVNRLATEALIQFFGSFSRELHIIHQTGSADIGMVRESYGSAGIKAVTASFFYGMEDVYREADIVISRAGATTLAELAALGKPAVLIPYPYAADNHQEKNANYYVEGGGALMFPENELTSRILADAVRRLLTAEERCVKMGEAMKRLAFPDAAEKMADVCLEEIGEYSS